MNCKEFITLATILLLRIPPAHAIEVAWSHRDLIIDSDVIVVATLTNTRGEMKYGWYVEEGDLQIERVIWGDMKPGDTLRLRWRNLPNIACPRTEHARRAGESLLWFLERDQDGTFSANTDQKVWPVEEVPTFIDSLAAYPYRILIPQFDIGGGATFAIHFRNATAEPLSVPTIHTDNARVTYGPGFDLKMKSRYAMGVEYPISVRPGSLIKDGTLARTVLATGDAVRVDVPFADMVDVTMPGGYWFEIVIDGCRIRQQLRIRSSWETSVERVQNSPGEMRFYIQALRKGEYAESAILMLEMKHTECNRLAYELMSLSDSLATSSRTRLMRLISWLDIPPEDKMDFYLGRTGDPSPEIRMSAGHGAGNILQSSTYRRDETVAVLLRMLDDEDFQTRRSVISTINNSRVTEALPSLRIIARHDPDEEIRRSAYWAIAVLEGRIPCKDRRIPQP